MIQMTVVVAGPVVWSLLFKSDKEPTEAFARITVASPEETVIIDDDYGQRFLAERSDIKGVLLEDTQKSQQGAIERALHNARTQAKANIAAQADPALKTAAMAQGAPMLTPFTNGVRN